MDKLKETAEAYEMNAQHLADDKTGSQFAIYDYQDGMRDGLCFTEDAFIAGAHWLGKQMVAKLKFASDMNSSNLDREPQNEVALFLMQFSEAQIQQVLDLMRIDKPFFRDDVLKEIGYVSPIKKK